MAPHSSRLAWKIPWTEEPRGLPSMASLGVGHDRATSLSLFTFMLWRRKWQPTPVFLPGESQGQRSLVGCCLWSRTESDTTEATQQQQLLNILKYLWMKPYDNWDPEEGKKSEEEQRRKQGQMLLACGTWVGICSFHYIVITSFVYV